MGFPDLQVHILGLWVFSAVLCAVDLIQEETVVLLAVFTITMFNQMAMEVRTVRALTYVCTVRMYIL